MRKKTLRWIILTASVALLSSLFNGCGENPLPPAPTPPSTQVTISGDAV